MPQSLSAVYVHVIFSTKDRIPFLRDAALRETLHAQLGGISKTLECAPIRVGGVEDHVHVLGRLSRTVTLADWVKELKRVSTRWLHQRGQEYGDFHWQSGYAAFSVSQSNLDQVAAYVANQQEHHRKTSFQDELRAFFRKHKIEWDERYVWD